MLIWLYPPSGIAVRSLLSNCSGFSGLWGVANPVQRATLAGLVRALTTLFSSLVQFLPFKQHTIRFPHNQPHNVQLWKGCRSRFTQMSSSDRWQLRASHGRSAQEQIASGSWSALLISPSPPSGTERRAGSIREEKHKSYAHPLLLAAGNVGLETQQSASSLEAMKRWCAMVTRDGCARTA